MTYKLPPLPEASNDNSKYGRAGFHASNGPVYTAEQMQAYAIAAIEAQSVPDGLLNVLDNFEKKERSPFQAYLAAGLVNELRTAMLASAPPAPQASEVQQEPLTDGHVTDGSKCWCDPELYYKDPHTGVEVWVHRSKQ